MRRVCAGILLSFVLVAHASAAAYDDFARGVAARNRGDFDTAISAFTAALASDLTANLRHVALLDRGYAHSGKGQCTDALADARAALALHPGYADAIALKGSAETCLRQFDAAVVDATALIAVQPRASSYTDRGTARWYQGDFTGAAADYSEALRLNPEAPYLVLWLAVAQARAGTLDPATIRTAARRIGDDWPAAVVPLFLGEAKPDAIEAAANKAVGDTRTEQLCEADFYVAQWLVSHADATEAKRHLERAVASCPKSYVEYDRAKYELERLK